MEDSLAILPSSMGKEPPGSQKKKPDPSKFIPAEKGGLVLADPKEEASPYSFSDSPAYVRNKKAEDAAKRAAELEGKDETRGFLQSVEELAKKQKWDEALQVLERRTAVPSGLFLVTRAVLRWKFGKYFGALQDAEEALSKYGSSAKAGPLAAAFASLARICLGSEVRHRGSCSKEMKDLVDAWERAEQGTLSRHVLGQGLFHPRQEDRLAEAREVTESMEATDGTYVAKSGVRIGYVFLKNGKDSSAPVIVHFHGNMETAADYRAPELAQRYRDLPVHLLVVDYRGYGWSSDQPSLATFLSDAEPLAEKLPEILVQHSLPWPYPGGIILSGRSLGAQVAVHVATLYPKLFRALVLDSAVATSATGDRLGRAPERAAALARWRKELEAASLEVLQPLEADLCGLSALEKIRAYDGQLLVLHGLADELVPFEGSESLHAAAGTRRKELVLVEDAGHNNVGRFDAYWSALRRFCLKVQLDDALPSVGPAVEHLCAVCAEKAVSKCGRCQKVWYCGRAHQAEHWKAHKNTCAGPPAEPKVKVVPEGEAHLAVFLTANLEHDEDCSAFSSCLASLGAQEEPVHCLCVSWHCSSPGILEQVRALVQELRAEPRRGCPEVIAVEAATALQPLEHASLLLRALAEQESAALGPPSATWVKFLDHRSLWSTTHAAVLLPALRRAAPEQRTLAVSCSRCATAKQSAPQGVSDAAAVAALLEVGEAELLGEARGEHLADLAMRLRVLQGFVEQTPAPALAHSLCVHRLHHKLSSTFGKKVQPLTPPEGEWMRWAPCHAALMGGAGDAPDALTESEVDVASGPPRGSSEAARSFRLGSAESVRVLASLRWRIERQLIVFAGEELPRKELRAVASEQMRDCLQCAGLDEVIGIEQWAREAAEEIAQEVAQQFLVQVEAGQK